MAKKKKEEIIEEKNYNKREAKFKANEWAVQKGLDPHLFLYWENQLMTETEFNKIVKKVRGE